MANTQVAPYFDDFNLMKNFHKVLFKPGKAVQVRELNQLQSMLQRQVASIGDHLFENGSMVIPGEFNFNVKYDFVSVSDVNYNDIKDILATNEIKIAQAGSQRLATVIQFAAPTDTDPLTFYVQYTNAGGDDAAFPETTVVSLLDTNNRPFTSAKVSKIGYGSVFDIAPGIFYVNGNFIRTDAQRVVLSKYDSVPSVVVGFRLKEDIVTAADDETLLDNAASSSNYGADGADRLKVTLKLEVYKNTETYDKQNFVEIAVFENGSLKRKARGPEYNVLEETLARRTYDESGDYTVSQFNLRIREHKDDGKNDGYDVNGFTDKMAVGVEPGKAYVKGFEVESQTTSYLIADKARETEIENNVSFTMPVGSFIIVNPYAGNIIDATNNPYIEFYRFAPNGVKFLLGRARIRYVLGESGNFLYIYDVQNSAGKNDSSFFSQATRFEVGLIFGDIDLGEVVILPTESAALHRLPVPNPKKVYDVSYATMKHFKGTVDSTGVVSLTASSNEIFGTVANGRAAGQVAGLGISDFSGRLTLGGIPVGKTVAVDVGAQHAGKAFSISLETIIQSAKLKTKTSVQTDVSITNIGINALGYSLPKTDVYEIVKVLENNVDRTTAFTLNTGATAEIYNFSSIRLKPGERSATSPLTVTLKYWEHSPGDYFAAESYTSGYETIPDILINNQLVNLSEFIDFRPSVNTSGGLVSGTMPSPYTRVNVDVEYYLPRIDKVFVSSRGVFGISKGVSSLKPTEPETPDNAMPLYTLFVPPYTKSVKDVQIQLVNNKRYTMRDIGKLEDRVSRLEYYTTLNMLENETNSMQVLDTNGFDRFKSGFIVDNFVDHSVGAYTVDGYNCSVSAETAQLRPQFYADMANFDYTPSLSSGVVKNGSLVTLPFTEQVYISQLEASGYMNVNPYAVYNWSGTMSLSPSSDTWFDTVYTLPDVSYNVFNNGNLTQAWNSWSVNWTGNVEVTSSSTTTATAITNVRTTTTTNVSVSDDREVNRSVIPYMRSREVSFSAKGLLPNGRVYAFFDNVNVSAYCRLKRAGGYNGEPLITDADGEIEGIFSLPNNTSMKFRTGAKQFTLIDNVENNRVLAISTADCEYVASGALVTRTQSIVATRNINTQISVIDIPPPPPPVIPDPIPVPPQPPRIVFRDPLAQSFLIDLKGGVFLTSVDLFFASKDDTVPVTLEIRNMVNGYPGQTVVPGSVVTKKPRLVRVSADSSAPTTFEFESPVYLSDGQEYCFVVLSNCNTYNVYIATMGEKSVITNAYISKQPYVGVMFKSQNSSTWTAEQTSDMKFAIKVARFNTNTVGLAAFTPYVDTLTRLSLNPLVAVSGSSIIKAVIPNHGLVNGAGFILKGAINTSGSADANINKTHTVTRVVSSDEVEFDLGVTQSLTGTFGGASVEASKNIKMDTMQAIAQQLTFEETDVSWQYEGITAASVNGQQSPYLPTKVYTVPVNKNFDLPDPMMVCSTYDSRYSGRNSGVLKSRMSTTLWNISPVIDVDRVGVIGVSNRISYPESLNETNDKGNAESRYITKAVRLAAPAKYLRAYLDILYAGGSAVKVYYKVSNTEGGLFDTTWTEMPSKSQQSASNSFVEYVYETPVLSQFSVFQVKIVLLSTSSTKIPVVKRFRGIALGT